MKDIVVTGGPCGGKTMVLEELSKLLRSYGIRNVKMDHSGGFLVD